MDTRQLEQAMGLPTAIRIDLRTGLIVDDARIERASKTISQMEHVFLDESARSRMDAGKRVYAVESWRPVTRGHRRWSVLGELNCVSGRGW